MNNEKKSTRDQFCPPISWIASGLSLGQYSRSETINSLVNATSTIPQHLAVATPWNYMLPKVKPHVDISSATVKQVDAIITLLRVVHTHKAYHTRNAVTKDEIIIDHTKAWRPRSSYLKKLRDLVPSLDIKVATQIDQSIRWKRVYKKLDVIFYISNCAKPGQLIAAHFTIKLTEKNDPAVPMLGIFTCDKLRIQKQRT